MKAGADWRDEIRRALGEARVAIILITRNFLESDFIARHELPPFLEAAKGDEFRILWIAVSASQYKETEIEKYVAANDPTCPLDRLKPAERNEALIRLGDQIKEAINP